MDLSPKSFVLVFALSTLGFSSLAPTQSNGQSNAQSPGQANAQPNAQSQSNPDALRRGQMARKRSPIVASTPAATTPNTNVSAPAPATALQQMQSQVPAPAPQQPLRPAQMAAIAPRISYQNGLLTVVAENSNFNDVLNGIRAATGLRVENTGGNANDRVAAKIGPASVRDVLLSLLQGSRYDFVMLGSNTDPDRIERIVLTPKSTGAGVVASSQQQQPAAAPAADANAEETNDIPETDDNNNEGFAPAAMQEQAQPAQGQQQPGAPGAAVPPGQQQPGTPAGTATTSPDNPQGVKTPEQLLQDLRNMQQQQQQQQQTPPASTDPNQRTPRPPR